MRSFNQFARLNILIDLMRDEAVSGPARHDRDAERRAEDRAVGRAGHATEPGRVSRDLSHRAGHGPDQRLAALDPRGQAITVHGPPVDRHSFRSRGGLAAEAIDLRGNRRLIRTRSQPDIERRLGRRRDHVGLGDAGERRTHGGRCHRGRAEVRAGPAEPAEATLEPRRLAQHGAQCGDGIGSGLGHRAVSHAAAHGHAGPDHTALLEAQLVLLRLADHRGGQRPAERRAAEMASADHVALLVHQCAHNEGPLKTGATPLDGGGRNHRRGKPALHVGSATSPDAAVGNVCSKRRMSARGGITFGDYVGVAFVE